MVRWQTELYDYIWMVKYLTELGPSDLTARVVDTRPWIGQSQPTSYTKVYDTVQRVKHFGDFQV